MYFEIQFFEIIVPVNRTEENTPYPLLQEREFE